MPVPALASSIRDHLQRFDFKALFIEDLGWERCAIAPFTVAAAGQTYTLRPIAQKRGPAVLLCDPDSAGGIPDYATRRAIETQARKTVHEHVIIYADRDKEGKPTAQCWQWVRRQPGKPAAFREYRYYAGQSGETLVQRLQQLMVDLTEEESTSLADVLHKMNATFNAERVTKRFYDRFKIEHAAFLRMIQGISSEPDREWYASLMLNRLMFSYFIQRQGFLDGDQNYLRNRLTSVRQRVGPDQFHSFYRSFLLRLFHDGLGKVKVDRSREVVALIGEIPYLNGGLFELHAIEQANPTIVIPDDAFTRVFAFFDDYNWHLDTEHVDEQHSDKEINPDVLGYIFEKYINQKQMGAYYTKEDITGYIGRNTILPHLFDTARHECKVAFEPGGEVWRLLVDDPDRYIYEAVRRGVDLPLPDEIAAGLDDVSRRGGWNRAIGDSVNYLPTETWREFVARRARCLDLRAKLAGGEVTETNDLITYNLDIVRFAQDVIERAEGPELVRAFWHALSGVTVLDPTCGSGAFLFAALEILRPLYEACLARMRSFVAAFERAGDTRSGKDFREVLAALEQHPNERYFVLKTIIINNLYGVDIMEEAVEIAKLRLFLKLVAQAENADQLEPLPDIDFNIRAGNTLVGFATYAEAERAVSGNLFWREQMPAIKTKAEELDGLFKQFRAQQTTHGGRVTKADKDDLRDRLRALGDTLDRFLAAEYGIDELHYPDKATFDAKFAAWRASHQPFHWFVEFYGIVQERGGFDVIIGNPPYVAYSKVNNRYSIFGYSTEKSGNLYAYVMERALRLVPARRYIGMIVPISSISADTFRPLMQLFRPFQSWLSSYSNRPGKLFADVEQRVTIFLTQHVASASILSSPYQHWYEAERSTVFDNLTYSATTLWPVSGMPLKCGSITAEEILDKMSRSPARLTVIGGGAEASWLHDGPTYWVRALPFEPNSGVRSERSNHYHRLAASPHFGGHALASVLSSSTFYLYFKAVSNCRDLGQREWSSFPFSDPSSEVTSALRILGTQLETRLRQSAVQCHRRYPSGVVEYYEYYPARAKPIIDQIDRVLARHYGFTDEELDFIINYDIKYRMGAESGSGDEGESGDGEE